MAIKLVKKKTFSETQGQSRGKGETVTQQKSSNDKNK